MPTSGKLQIDGLGGNKDGMTLTVLGCGEYVALCRGSHFSNV